MTQATHPLLHELRGIHLPPPITQYALAPGWYALIILLAALCCYSAYVIIRTLKRAKRKRIVRTSLVDLKQAYHDKALPPHEVVMQLSILLRRIALAYYPRRDVAALVGEAWLARLDTLAGATLLQSDTGRLLITAGYQAKCNAPLDPLFPLIETWLQREFRHD